MRRLLLAVAIIGMASIARADVAVSLYDQTTTNYAQIHSPTGMSVTYRMNLPLAVGTTNYSLSIQSIAGSTMTLQWSPGSSGGASSLGVNYNGVVVTTPTALINFAGSGVSVTGNGSTATVTINGGGSGTGFSLALTTGPPSTYSNPALSSSSVQTVIVLNQSLFTELVNGATVYVGVNMSSFTLQGNAITFQMVGASTSSLQSQINALGVSTGSIQSNFPVSFSTNTMGALNIGTQSNLTASGAAVLSGSNIGVGQISVSTGLAPGVISSTWIPTDVAYADKENNWSHAQTFVSSATFNSPVGSSFTYQVSVGSFTGAALTTCGDSTHALGWSSTTDLFSCQNVTGSGGGGGASTLAVTTGTLTSYANPAISSPTAVLSFNQNQFTETASGTTAYMNINFSSITALGTLTASGNATLSGSNIGVGPIKIGSGTIGPFDVSTTSASVTGSGGLSVTGNISDTGGITISSGLTVSMPAVIVGTSTITSSMTVVLASAPVASAWITLTLPPASATPGLDLMIYKVNGTTAAIKIVGAGSDLIEGSGTIRLDGQFQHASLHSLGAIGWGSGLGGIQYTPAAIRINDQSIANFQIGVASRVVQCPFFNEVPVEVLGFRMDGQTTGSGTLSAGIFDRNGNFLVATSTATIVSGVNNYLLAAPYNLPPGYYLYAETLSNTTANMSGGSPNDKETLCSVGSTPSNMDLSKITLTTGGAQNSNIPHADILVSGGKLAS